VIVRAIGLLAMLIADAGADYANSAYSTVVVGCGTGSPFTRIPSHAHPIDVERNCFADQPFRFVTGFTDRNAARQVRHIRTIARRPLLNDDGVLHLKSFLVIPACRNTELSVRSGMSCPSLPETVTVPGLKGW
jgi:hypothetical protein